MFRKTRPKKRYVINNLSFYYDCLGEKITKHDFHGCVIYRTPENSIPDDAIALVTKKDVLSINPFESCVYYKVSDDTFCSFVAKAINHSDFFSSHC